MGNHWKDGYSASVDIYLLVNGEKLQIALVEERAFVLQDFRALPIATKGELVLKIDENERRYSIVLDDGSREANEFVKYSLRSA